MSGIEFAFARKERVRFLTLTSTADSPEDIHHSWRLLVKRIRREYGKFEYLAIRELTGSGLKHLHILFRGGFVPQKWVSSTWGAIHGARITYVEEVKGKSKQVANYIAKYITTDSQRFWWSWGWVYRRFVRDWKDMVHKYGEIHEAVYRWHAWIRKIAVQGSWNQLKIDGIV